MNPTELALNCSTHKHCTSCPSRIECITRKKFYDEAEYQSSIALSNTLTLAKCLSDGVSYEDASLIIHYFNKEMYEKRQRELELHPTYSPE